MCVRVCVAPRSLQLGVVSSDVYHVLIKFAALRVLFSTVGNIGDAIMVQVRSEMRPPNGSAGSEGEGEDPELLSNTPPLEMREYLESVYARNEAYAVERASGNNSLSSSPTNIGGKGASCFFLFACCCICLFLPQGAPDHILTAHCCRFVDTMHGAFLSRFEQYRTGRAGERAGGPVDAAAAPGAQHAAHPRLHSGHRKRRATTAAAGCVRHGVLGFGVLWKCRFDSIFACLPSPNISRRFYHTHSTFYPL